MSSLLGFLHVLVSGPINSQPQTVQEVFTDTVMLKLCLYHKDTLSSVLYTEMVYAVQIITATDVYTKQTLCSVYKSLVIWHMPRKFILSK